MGVLHQLQILVVLLAIVLALTTVAHRFLLPYPIVLVVGGLILGLIPQLPPIELNPDLVFFVFLPPILWGAAYFTSWRDFRANLRPISLLAVGLVLMTTGTVAVLAHAAMPGMDWATAITLGAIVSPPDAVAATAIARQLQIPRRLITILEGESLVNDATALVLYRTAVGAVVSGSFLWQEALMDFMLAGLGGLGVGLAVGGLSRLVLKLTHDSYSETGVTLLASYVAWVLGEQLHLSAVLACVAGGLYLRQHFSELVSPMTRFQARAVWETVVFILNGVIFILIGLQVGAVRRQFVGSDLRALLLAAALIGVGVVVVRLLWVPLAAYLPRIMPSIRARDPMPPASALFLLGWTGMRGIVSLAAALALPLATNAGTQFPYRDEILVITFVVIFVTLVLQGLSLAPLIRRLNLPIDDTVAMEESLVRHRMATAALTRLQELTNMTWTLPDHLERLRMHYARRAQRFSDPSKIDPDCSESGAEAFRRLRHETLSAERRAAISLRNEGHISDEILHRVEQELDIEAIRLGLGDLRADGAVPFRPTPLHES